MYLRDIYSTVQYSYLLPNSKEQVRPTDTYYPSFIWDGLWTFPSSLLSCTQKYSVKIVLVFRQIYHNKPSRRGHNLRVQYSIVL